jgi:Clp amino terminal domain, pathogenicity island component
MFERYTEKARRVIFFARYEASQLSSPYIETEHILLGIIKEAGAVLRSLKPDLNFDDIRKAVVDRPWTQKSVSTPPSVDLPLSNECKRVLAYAAEEAERMGHHHIGSEHLLLGLLREKKSEGAQLLYRAGIDLADLRVRLRQLPDSWEENPNSRFDGDKSISEPVTIHGAPFNPSYVSIAAADCRRFFWEKRDYVAPDIVVGRGGAISFDRSLVERRSDFHLVEGGWNEVACLICRWQFLEGSDPQRNSGYTNGRDWLCFECYERFVGGSRSTRG